MVRKIKRLSTNIYQENSIFIYNHTIQCRKREIFGWLSTCSDDHFNLLDNFRIFFSDIALFYNVSFPGYRVPMDYQDSLRALSQLPSICQSLQQPVHHRTETPSINRDAEVVLSLLLELDRKLSHQY